MVRLITLLFILTVLYLYSLQAAQEPRSIQTMPGTSIITVKELPPIGTE